MQVCRAERGDSLRPRYRDAVDAVEALAPLTRSTSATRRRTRAARPELGCLGTGDRRGVMRRRQRHARPSDTDSRPRQSARSTRRAAARRSGSPQCSRLAGTVDGSVKPRSRAALPAFSHTHVRIVRVRRSSTYSGARSASSATGTPSREYLAVAATATLGSPSQQALAVERSVASAAAARRACLRRTPARSTCNRRRRVAAVRPDAAVPLSDAISAAPRERFSTERRKLDDSMRLALAQINSVVGDLDGNRERILGAARRGEAPTAPTSSSSPSSPSRATRRRTSCCGRASSAPPRSPSHELAREAAGSSLLVGAPHFDRDLYNACAVCAGGEVKAVYRKRFLPNYGVFDEDRYFAPGRDLTPARASARR